MEEKEKSCRMEEWVAYFLAGIAATDPEDRLKVLQTTFMKAAENKDDEMTYRLLYIIYQAYHEAEGGIALETDRDFGKASLRAYTRHCDYLKGVYWQLPRGPFLRKTKLEIIRLWMRQWQRWACDFTDKGEEAIDAFHFLVSAYIGKTDGDQWEFSTSTAEKDDVLKFFRDHTDYRFIPEIAEKWLKMPDVPEEIKKIFIIARARNGGIPLIERDIKNAEMLKPLDIENRSEAALEFHKKFCSELAIIDDRIKQFIKELGAGLCSKAEKIEIDKIRLSNQKSEYEIVLSICYKKNDLPYSSASQIADDIHLFFSKYNRGRYVQITYILQEEEEWRIAGSDIVYFSQ
jgi:hypothetical protein